MLAPRAPAAARRGRLQSPSTPDRTVTLAQPPARIISLCRRRPRTCSRSAPASRSWPSTTSRTTRRAPNKLSGYTPNVEASPARADLVVASNDIGGLVKALGLRIPVLLEPAATRTWAARTPIRQLGTATGHPAGGAAGGWATATGELDPRLLPAGREGAHRLPQLEPDYYSVTSRRSSARSTLLGLKDIADAAKGAGSSCEALGRIHRRLEPDLIVLADSVCGQTAARSRRDPAGRRSRP